MWRGLTDTILVSRARSFRNGRVRVVVITRNSAHWFGALIEAYRELRIEPMVLLDASSDDGTEALLKRNNIVYARVFPEFPRVEAMIRLIPDHTDAEWVLRLDDDEFPSLALVRWINRRLHRVEASVVGLPRRWVRLGESGHCEYSNHQLLRWHEQRMDIQWRLFRPRRVQYQTDIHSAGFLVPPGSPVAPESDFFVHFDWVIRSWRERKEKLARYDRQQSGSGYRFRDLYLWETCDPEAHAFMRMETDEFDRLARSLSHPSSGDTL
jgi:hypothetical protein